MGDEDEGDAGGLLDVLELHLHVLAELEVEGRQRLVQEQDFGLIDQGAGNGDALLLTAGEARDGALFKALEGNQRQHLGHGLLDLGLGDLLFPQGEGHVFKHVQMREQGVALEYGVDVALMGRQAVDVLPHKDNVAAVRGLKTADDAQQRRLAAARRAQQGDKLVVIDVEVDVVEHDLAVKGFCDVLDFDDLFHVPAPNDKQKSSYAKHNCCKRHRKKYAHAKPREAGPGLNGF